MVDTAPQTSTEDPEVVHHPTGGASGERQQDGRQTHQTQDTPVEDLLTKARLVKFLDMTAKDPKTVGSLRVVAEGSDDATAGTVNLSAPTPKTLLWFRSIIPTM